MPRILLVDDDVELTTMLAEYLTNEAFEVEVACAGIPGAARAMLNDCELVVLDVMLPDQSGIETLRQIRAASQVPVLMLTARGYEIDKVVGLELGADDYVPKPCTPRELAARIRAILRRTSRATVSATVSATTAAEPKGASPGDGGRGDDGRVPAPLTAGAVSIWPRSRRAEWRGREVELTSTQFSVLEVLVRHAGTVVSKADLSRLALGRPLGRFDRSIDVHISILRQRLDGPGGGDEVIKTVRGVGYQLAVD